ncbi:MAG: enoyl-CoA hydratase/isomerase family protein [Pseudolabrys sp.]|jgi:enoyl-CoA hydratase/carnithine racemase
MAGDQILRISDSNGVRHLLLNRPAVRNALNHDLMDALRCALSEADSDADVRVIVLRGEGKGFCAGADLKATAALADETSVRGHARQMRQVLELPPTLNKPVIAQVHGFALGAGFALALACDAAVCGDGVALGYPEAKHGIVPALVLPSLLRLAGTKVTFDMMATGRLIDGARAQQLGLVRCVPDAELEQVVAAYAADLAGRSEVFMRLLKQLIRDAHIDPKTAMAAAEQTNVEARLKRLSE